MDLFESLDHAFETLFEDVESRMHHLLQILLGKKSRWPEKDKPDAEEKAKQFIRDFSQYDPTQGKNYMMFITRQVAAGAIRLPEDGILLKETLEKFMNFSRKATWKHPKDVMQYQHWRELQKLVGEYEKEMEVKTAQSTENILATKAKEGAEVILDMDVKALSGLPNYKIYMVSTPIAATMFGKGTQWCTSIQHDNNIYKAAKPDQLDQIISNIVGHRETSTGNPWAGLTPEKAKQLILDLNAGNLAKKEIKVPNIDRLDSALSTASSYLRGGPLYIIYKNGAPYIQLTHDGSQIMDVSDMRLKTVSPALAVVLKELMDVPQAPEIAPMITVNMRKPGKVSSTLVKRLTEEIKRSEAYRARLEQQKKPGTPPATPQ